MMTFGTMVIVIAGFYKGCAGILVESNVHLPDIEEYLVAGECRVQRTKFGPDLHKLNKWFKAKDLKELK